jgi:hypothetical protein
VRGVNLWLAGGILAVSVAGSVAAMLFVRRRAPDGGYFSNSDRAAGVFGVLATSFSVLMAFVIFLAFTSYDGSKQGAEAEALTVGQQFETAQFLPSAATPLLEGQLICYGRAVVNQEWPDMAAAQRAPSVSTWALALFETLKATDPQTPTEQAAFAKWLDQTSDRETGRRDRLHSADGVIPWPMLFILLVAALMVVGYMLFFADSGERRISQAVLMGTVAAMVVTSLLVVDFLDHPYRTGVGAIRPTAMVRTLRTLDQASAELGKVLVVPCDQDGRPTRSSP